MHGTADLHVVTPIKLHKGSSKDEKHGEGTVKPEKQKWKLF